MADYNVKFSLATVARFTNALAGGDPLWILSYVI